MAPPDSTALVLEHVTVIDVEHGVRLRGRRVVIVGNRIRALGEQVSVQTPPGARVVDGRGKYLILGLWDMHFHATVLQPTWAAIRLQANAVYRQLIASGITGIRDPGSPVPFDTFRVWKREIAAGRRIGPRLIVTGLSIEASAHRPDQSPAGCERDPHPLPCLDAHVRYISNAEEAHHLVDSLKAAGADMVKIRSVPSPVWFALAAEARRAGIPFGGHFTSGSDGLSARVDGLVASDSGARILDHELWANACGWNADTVRSLIQCAAAAARLRRNHTWIAGGIGGARIPGSLEERALRYGEAETGYESGRAWRPPSLAERRRLPTGAELAAAVSDSARLAPNCQRALLAYAADLPWMPGPDFPNLVPVTATHLLLLYPVLCGVPAWWALRAATLEPARALGLTDSLGTVAAGKVADLDLLDGDPLEDIWNVTKIAAVVANGHYFDRATLDRLLTEAGQGWAQLHALRRRYAAEQEQHAAAKAP